MNCQRVEEFSNLIGMIVCCCCRCVKSFDLMVLHVSGVASCRSTPLQITLIKINWLTTHLTKRSGCGLFDRQLTNSTSFTVECMKEWVFSNSWDVWKIQWILSDGNNKVRWIKLLTKKDNRHLWLWCQKWWGQRSMHNLLPN